MKHFLNLGSPYRRFFAVIWLITVALSAVLLVAVVQGKQGNIKASAVIVFAAAIILMLCAIVLLGALISSRSCTNKRFLAKHGAFLMNLLNEESYFSHSQLELTAEVLKTQAQMSSLQSQINPHFLYNTLESIRSKALMHDAEEVATMIETLARLLRYNISRSDKESTIADELENVKNYIQIQNYRFRGKFALKLELDDLGDLPENYMLPTLTLQPIVENAIHHGLEPQIGPGTITIRGFQTENKVILQVQDDGVGMSSEKLADLRNRLFHPELAQTPLREGEGASHRGAGIALKNVHQRLQLFFGPEYGLEIISASGVGTQVELSIPLQPKSLKTCYEERAI